MNGERSAVITLNTVAETGPRKIMSLINIFGCAQNVLNASEKDLTAAGQITQKAAAAIKKAAQSAAGESEIKLAAENEIEIITYNDQKYPADLKDISDFPPVIYVKGSFEKYDEIAVGVVGSRTPTNYGRAVTADFCRYFAQNGICVVSGLARGIDTEAHETVLKNEGRTIAVLGNGLLQCYPAENRKLQDKIGKSGVIVSEFPLRQKPDKSSFPRRNRIIAGLSKAVVITEAALESGAMITAKLAVDYGRDVFAVPGPVFSNYSKGPNSLIKDGAMTALKPEDVVDSMHVFASLVKRKNKNRKLTSKNINDITNTRNLNVLTIIGQAVEGVSVDKLSAETGIDIPELAMILMNLELDGFVRQMPGQIYIRNV